MEEIRAACRAGRGSNLNAFPKGFRAQFGIVHRAAPKGQNGARSHATVTQVLCGSERSSIQVLTSERFRRIPDQCCVPATVIGRKPARISPGVQSVLSLLRIRADSRGSQPVAEDRSGVGSSVVITGPVGCPTSRAASDRTASPRRLVFVIPDLLPRHERCRPSAVQRDNKSK